MKKWLWIFLFFTRVVGAEEEILTCELQSILFVSRPALLEDHPQVTTPPVVSRDVAFLSSNSSFLETLKAYYIGAPLTRKVIREIKEQVIKFYRSENQPFAVVTIPKQDWESGVLQVVVREAVLGEIRSTGNEYYSNTHLFSYIRTKPGQPILEEKMVEDIAWMNKNPFRRTDAIYRPGRKPGIVDLDLITVDRWPYRVYAGADNTGTIATERDRIFAGFNLGKTIISDADVSFQYTCSPNWNRFYSYTLSTRVPCFWRHEFLFYGGYAHVQPELSDPTLLEKGYSWQVDGRYRIPIMDTPDVLQTIVIGYDFKETGNQIWQNRASTFKAVADINQFMLGYEFGWKDIDRRINLIAEVYANPGGITNQNRNSEYENLRFEAKSQYAYLMVSHAFAQKMPIGAWVSYNMKGQISSANLLPSEQLSLTGYNAVRGFEERILLLDNGAIFNVTIETPHISFAKLAGSKTTVDDFYILAFFDSGLGVNHQRASGEHKFKTLGSVGPGVRYQIDRFITARFDYGFQLWHRGFFNPTHSRYNFGVMLSY